MKLLGSVYKKNSKKKYLIIKFRSAKSECPSKEEVCSRQSNDFRDKVDKEIMERSRLPKNFLRNRKEEDRILYKRQSN